MINKIINWFKYFRIMPTDIHGGWRFQITIPIGKNPSKHNKEK
jgi:hypothetical protein